VADRAAEPPGQGGHRHLLRVGDDPGPERPADRGHDHPDPLRGHAQDRGHVVADPERRLAGGVEDQAVAAGLGHGHRAGRLQGGGGQPLVDEAGPDHHLGPLQGPGRLRPAPRLGQVAGLEQPRGVLVEGGQRVGEHRQRLVVGLDRLGRVQGLGPALGHHHRHRLAQEPDDAGGQHRPGHGIGPVAGRQGRQVQVGGTEHPGHPGHGGGRGGVDGDDPPRGQRGPDEDGVQRPRGRQVAGEDGRPRDQGRVLPAEGVGAGARVAHGESLRHAGRPSCANRRVCENRCQQPA
jgi:hypothetical protein